MKKKNAVVICVSKNITFSAGVLIMNLESVMSGVIDEYVVIHNGVNESDKEAMHSMAEVRFVEYQVDDSYFSRVNPQLIYQFTKIVFAKFECLRLLSEYENIVFTDTDVLVRESLSELFEPCDAGMKIIQGEYTVRTQFNRNICEYEMDKCGISAGLIVFHDNLPLYREMHEWCYSALKKYSEYLQMPEQAIFDIMIQEFNIRPKLLDPLVYCRLPAQAHIKPQEKILHTAGQPKLWSGYHCPEWKRYYEKWVAIGGQKIDMRKYMINKIMPPGTHVRRIAQKIYHFIAFNSR